MRCKGVKDAKLLIGLVRGENGMQGINSTKKANAKGERQERYQIR